MANLPLCIVHKSGSIASRLFQQATFHHHAKYQSNRRNHIPNSVQMKLSHMMKCVIYIICALHGHV